MTTDAALEAAAVASNGASWAHMDAFKVFARMSPTGKAQVRRVPDGAWLMTHDERLVANDSLLMTHC